MKHEETIFAPRPEGGIAPPLPQELNDFLENTVMDAVGEPHITDLLTYRRLLSQMETFLSRKQPAADPGDIDARIVFGVHRHARFLNRELLLAASQYKYHLHAMAGLDFAAPAEFIAAAEEKRKRLRKTKLSDVERLMRLDEMVRERQKMLENLKKRWDQLAAEMLDIAGYIHENLVRMERLCKRSIGLLAAEEVGGSKGPELEDGIKTYFKERLKAALAVRKVTSADVEQVKRDVAELSKELAAIIRDDLFRMADVYEVLFGHISRVAADIGAAIKDLGTADVGSREGHLLRFRRIERMLVSLLSGYPREIEPAKVPPPASSHAIVAKKRQEMHDYLFGEMHRERREKRDRRERPDRRKRQDPSYAGPERRSRDRREGKSRRA